MIILKLKAGLGNQMFQYAFAKALALKYNETLKIDTSWFKHIPEKDTPREYGLKHFNICSETCEYDESKFSIYSRKISKKIRIY